MRYLSRAIFAVCLGFPFPAAVRGQDHAHEAPPARTLPPARPPKAETAREEPRAPVEVPPEQQARMGLVLSEVVRKPVSHAIRAVGIVTADETREAHVHTRINGWIEKIQTDYVGKPVRKGQSLFDLYSPELFSTQEEYLAARGKGAAGREIAAAALDRLRLWGVSRGAIARLDQTGRATRAVTFESPVNGVIVRKSAIQGMYITPDMELYHIADLSTVWIVVTLYEYDLLMIKPGDKAEIELPYDQSARFTAKIAYVYPELDPETRTAKARIEFPNEDYVLKPGMFANISLKKDLGPVIVVPETAVIDTGLRKLVFVRTSDVRFEPREVKVGARAGADAVILSGLKEGERVVTSAHFLIDAESKLRAALEKGGTGPVGHGSHKGK